MSFFSEAEIQKSFEVLRKKSPEAAEWIEKNHFSHSWAQKLYLAVLERSGDLTPKQIKTAENLSRKNETTTQDF